MASPGLDSIDRELRQIHSYLRTQPVTSEDKRAQVKRMDILLLRRFRLQQREAQRPMIHSPSQTPPPD